MSRTISIVVIKIILTLIIVFPAITYGETLTKVEPCEILTQVDAEDIMGEKMKTGRIQEQKVIDMKMCLYEPVDDNSFSMLQISIIQGDRAKTIYSEIKANFPDREIVNGTGDEAFIATPGIHILKNGYYLSIAAGNLNRNRDKVLVAGKKAVAKLERTLR